MRLIYADAPGDSFSATRPLDFHNRKTNPREQWFSSGTNRGTAGDMAEHLRAKRKPILLPLSPQHWRGRILPSLVAQTAIHFRKKVRTHVRKRFWKAIVRQWSGRQLH